MVVSTPTPNTTTDDCYSNNCYHPNQMQYLPSSSTILIPKPKTLISLLFNSTYHTFSLSLLQTHKTTNHFNQILSHVITSNLFTDPFVSSKLLHFSLSNSNFTLSFSHTLFLQIQNPNAFAWSFILRAYSHSSVPQQAIYLYNFMRRKNLVLGEYTFPFVLKACGRVLGVEKGQEIHCLSVKLGLDFDVFVQNALVSMYFQCGFVDFSRKVFDFVPNVVRDVVTWNSVISGYVQNDCCEKALKVFDELLCDNNVRYNEVTLVSGLTACARIGLIDLGRKVHGLSVVNGFFVDVFLGSSLIDMYTKCGRLEDAQKVFDRIRDRNIVCWTSMIAGYVQSDLFKEAITLFREMLVIGIQADSATVACVISACGHSGALDQGRWVNSYCERNGIEMNATVKNALIDMYSRCGDVEKALEIFHGLMHRDVYSWSVIISGLAMNGQSDESLELFSRMETSSDIRPNEVTFLGVLSACSHGGLVEEGFHYLEAMIQRYNLAPRIEHYGCMVDLLSRANLLVEAERFISSLPIDPDIIMWRSLLFACRNHRNLKLAEFVAKKIEELEPKGCGAHVLLSNVYASASRWIDVKRVRKGMAVQGIQKQPGCSFIEIDGIVHEFLVADNSHCQIDVICQTILEINKFLRSEVFDPDILDYLQ